MMQLEVSYRRTLEEKDLFETNLKSQIDNGFYDSTQLKQRVDELRADINTR